MNALEVAPGAKAGHVLVGIVAAVGPEAEMMRGDIATATARTLTTVAVALVDVRVFDFGMAWAPGVDEELAGEAEEGGVAEGGAAVAQIDGLPMSKIARGAGLHAQMQGDVR